MNEKPTIPYWHLWTDEDGTSRQSRCTLEDFELKPIQPGSASQWQRQKTSGTMSSMVTVLPLGVIGGWHENPEPQWIIPLARHWFVEAMDGTRAEIGSGELAFRGHQNCHYRRGSEWP